MIRISSGRLLRLRHALELLVRGALLVSMASVTAALTQCPSREWQPGEGLRGFDGKINATVLWDRDGPGGQPPVLVAAGVFTVAGTVFAKNIALWNGATWEPLGNGDASTLNGTVHSLAVLPSGELVVGGAFSMGGTQALNRIARWNGSGWSALGTGMDVFSTTVSSLAVAGNGDLIAVGSFTAAGGVATTNIARWNGSQWIAVSPEIGSEAKALTTDPLGNVIAAGNFRSGTGEQSTTLARWNGSTWATFAPGYSSPIQAVTVLPDGDIVVGGDGVARWNGSSWTAMNDILVGSVLGLTTLKSGTLVAMGFFGATDVGVGTTPNVAYWNGSAWIGIGGGVQGVGVTSGTLLPNGDLVVGGNFFAAGSVAANHIARWDGHQWHYFGSGFAGGSEDSVQQLVRLTNGVIVASGKFTAAGSTEAKGVARWNGASWSPMEGPSGVTTSGMLALLKNGDLIASGGFDSRNNFPTYPLVRWDGNDWIPYGPANTRENPSIRALAVMTNGDVVAGGAFTQIGGFNVSTLARWDGSTWSRLGPPTGGSVSALAVLPNGDLIVGGEFTQFGGIAADHIARWNGTEWLPLGLGVNGAVQALKATANGDLLVGGSFGTAGGLFVPRIARWDGAQWSGLGTGLTEIGFFSVNAITVLSNGDVVVGGASSQPANIARWNGSAWLGLGEFGVGGAFLRQAGDILALEAMPAGGFVMGGLFTAVNGRISHCFAHWGCPADLDSPPMLTGVGMGTGGLRFFIEGTPGKSYEVRYTQDFQVWESIQGGLQGSVAFEDNDPGRRANPRGFYQAREE